MKTLIIGDSWGAGHNADNGLDDGWRGFDCRNLAVDGSTAQGWASNVAWLESAVEAAKDADAVIVSLLGNDAFAAFADGRIDPSEIQEGHKNLRAVVEKFTGKRIIVMLYAIPRIPDFRAVIGLCLLNGAIRSACTGLTVEFADTQKWLTPDQVVGMPPHPTTEGWRVIRENMEQLINREATR